MVIVIVIGPCGDCSLRTLLVEVVVVVVAVVVSAIVGGGDDCVVEAGRERERERYECCFLFVVELFFYWG